HRPRRRPRPSARAALRPRDPMTAPASTPTAPPPSPSPPSPQRQRPAPAPPPAPPAAPLPILLFTAGPPDLRGRASAISTRLASALRARGHSVIETWGAEPGRPRAADELPLVEIRSRWGLPTLQSLAGSARFVGRVVRLLQRERPQIVNIHFIHARMAQVLLWLRPLFGYRLMLSAHGSDLFDPPDGNDTWLPRVLPRA